MCDFRKFRQIKRTILSGFGFLDTCRHRNWMQLSTLNGVSLSNFSQTQNQPSTPNHEKLRCPKNPKWIVPCKIKIFCYDFEFRKMYHVHSTTQNQRYFYAISDVTRYFGSLFWIKSCAICEGLNVLEGPQNGLLFYHRLVACAQKSYAFCEGLNVLGDKKSVVFVQF